MSTSFFLTALRTGTYVMNTVVLCKIPRLCGSLSRYCPAWFARLLPQDVFHPQTVCLGQLSHHRAVLPQDMGSKALR